MISIKIVDIDYYMCYPITNLDVKYSEFRGVEVRQVPVIQIFGTSQTGLKTCLNVHGIFPYIYIPYDGSEPAGKLSYKIASELDKALNISLGQAASNTVHIHNIVLVSGIPFYGYHERQHQFFKIYFYNPALIKKACSLLENGAIFGKSFQPYESHINYILQFMIDFNLHGMSFVNISQAMYRSDPNCPELLDNIPPHMILPNDIQRRSVCKYELDVLASNIKNKDDISSGKLTINPGIAALWEDEKQRRRDKEMDSQISFSLTQKRDNIRPTMSHLFFEEKLANKLLKHVISDESTLDKSVYPAETPDDGELINASTADHTILDSTSLDETIKETQSIEFDEKDAKLLAILQNLKETAAIEDDSILSQQVEEPENELSDNEEDQNLSLLNKDVTDEDSVWENTFWDECEVTSEQIPQIDGQFDIESSDECKKKLNIIEIEPIVFYGQQNKNEYRHANEVYIYSDFKIPESMKLNPGINKLILSKRRSDRSVESSITILSDICIKCAENSNSSVKESDYEPLYIIDDNCNFSYKKKEPNIEVVLNDVSLVNISPELSPKWDGTASEPLPIFDTNYQTQQLDEVLISQFESISSETDNAYKEEIYNSSNKKEKENTIKNEKIVPEKDIKSEDFSRSDKNVSVVPNRGRGKPKRKKTSSKKNEKGICKEIQVIIRREELQPNIEKTNHYNLRSISSPKDAKQCCKFCNVKSSKYWPTNSKNGIEIQVPSEVYHLSTPNTHSHKFLKELKKRKVSPERGKTSKENKNDLCATNKPEINDVSKVEVLVSIKKENFIESEKLEPEHLKCKFNFISEKSDEQNNKKDTPKIETSKSLSSSENPNFSSGDEVSDLIDNLKKMLSEDVNRETPECDTIDYIPKIEDIPDIFEEKIIKTKILNKNNLSSSSTSASLETPKRNEYLKKDRYVEEEVKKTIKISNNKDIELEKQSVFDKTKTEVNKTYLSSCSENIKITKGRYKLTSKNELLKNGEHSVIENQHNIFVKDIPIHENQIRNIICSNNNESAYKNYNFNNNQDQVEQTKNQENQNDNHSFLFSANKQNSNQWYPISDELKANQNQVVETEIPASAENDKIETEYKIHISCKTIEEFKELKDKLLNLNLYGLSDSPSSTCTSTSDEEISLKFSKESDNIKLCTLDGQADSNSDSTSSKEISKNQLKSQKILKKKKILCRPPGLSKKSVKRSTKNKNTSVINNSHEKNINIATSNRSRNYSSAENRTSENTEEELDEIDKKIRTKSENSNNILEPSKNRNNSSKNGLSESEVNNIINDIYKRELQVVLVPLNLKYKTNLDEIIEIRPIANVKPKTQIRRYKNKSCTNNSTDSSDIEQPDKKQKTDFSKFASNEETITSSKTKSSSETMLLNRSITKHMVLCSSSSPEETTTTETKKVKAVKSRRIKRNRLSTKKILNSTNVLANQQSEIVSLQTIIDSGKQHEITRTTDINSPKLSEKLKNNERIEVETSKHLPTTNFVNNTQQQSPNKIVLQTHTKVTEKEPSIALSLKNTEKKVLEVDDCDEIFPVLNLSTLSKVCKEAVVKLEKLSPERIKKLTISSEKKENKQVNSMPNKTTINKLGPRFKERIRKIKSENTSPNRNKKKVVSPKYSPLNVIIRSPKKHANSANSEYEPDIKKLKNHFIDAELNKNSVKTVKNSRSQLSQGTGELQFIRILKNPKNIIADKIIPTNFELLNEEIKSPDTIKKNLFNTKIDQLNTTVVEEFKTCTYEKSSKNIQRDIDFVRELKEKEELFVKELESNYGIKRNSDNHKNENFDQKIDNASHSNKTSDDSNLASKINEDILEPIDDNIKSRIFEVIDENQPQEPISNKSAENPVRRIVKKKDKKPMSPSKLHNSDYFNITPEKNLSFNITNFYSPRETLSQQNEKKLYDVENYNTKSHNLTASELYDLRRNFAPQPGTSKMEEEFEYNSPNFSFSYNDISLMDNTFILNSSNTLQINQNISGFDITVTGDSNNNSKIWMPKYFPPSKSDIENSLAIYNIPENRYQEPFYSDYSDVTAKVDIGHNVLKISSTIPKDLEFFESSIEFTGVERWRKDKFKEFYSEEILENIKITLASHKKIVLTPVNLPPTRKEIISWIHMKNNEAAKKLVEKVEKRRIIIPQSPGNESINESMTLSPYTPASLAESLNITKSSQNSTPASSKCSSPNVSRRGKPKKKGNLQRKVLFSQSKQKTQEELKLLNITENHSGNDSCHITGVTLDNTHGFQMSYENLQDAKALSEHQYLTVLVVEVHISTRGDFFPDPQYDSVRAIFYSILNDVPGNSSLPCKETGVIVVNTLPGSPTKQSRPILEGTGAKCQVLYVKSEIELIDEFVKLIRKWDPDIFVGFEIEMLSWGYLIDRCYVIGINLPVQISRTNPAIIKNKTVENKQGELKLTGRIILDAWRLFRHEIALQSYTFENLMYHILHQRVPAHSFRNLSFWWEYRSNYFRHITVNYYITRVEGILKLLDQLDLIGRTSELARLFGIQFFEVLSRGSQFRVESMMLRLAKPLNYIPISPSVQQRAKMRAPESLPLILEPESRFYIDPVIVLDFQSLYPSIIIAYNYCFSTCIGRVEKLGTNNPFEFGACQLRISRSRVQKLQSKINFSPCGVGFVKPEVRQGILPRMLKEILETRLMVKSSMKENKQNKLLQRVLHNRQLGLKLIANVTYGYTSANFSGRMPCIEVGDSVVSKGRETLERAINLIETTKKWRARVVYGDTDSLFVLVPGRSREDAFKIGAEMAEAVTNDNPSPVKLKLEKVYQPCILQTKKRYVGYMYESPDQKEPEYNAKGIETVRRDGCPAVAKILEKSLRLLFETRDVSLIKRYVVRQFEKLITGRASIQDLIFAREFRGFGGYRPGACVPALELTRKWIAVDKRREPRKSERVPYIVVHGPPGLPLIRLVKCPREILNQEQGMSLRPNAVYYITKVIAPPLNRCLGLIGADVLAWYNEMPRKQLQILPTDVHFEKSKKSTISQYFVTMSCTVCNNQTRDGLCDDCINNPQQTIVVLQEKVQQWERSFDDIKQVCRSCCGRIEYTDCTSLDCPVLYRLSQTKRDLKQVPFVRNLLSKFV